ncbi:TlpA disulfide reductase family protein [Curvibacter sp. HBC28]|uniref:TlpA disulfide reductase family protein n=1 Tax=Curvibacter microcysteis TaxID=3026419 RepID=A0ABT5MD47_9BURK|nr:TlpA disulfide reductase family protein [Curvibacter sp. HBC28]MDD0813046.1 TlpA disulfide reductase family protein [Curvibacter sp. HBC28]
MTTTSSSAQGAPVDASVRRRRWLGAGVAGLAVAAGAGFSWWRRPGAGEGALDPAQAQALWALKFERPGGGELALADFKGKPLLINFWATWCPPCVEELPLLDRFQRENSAKRWQVLGLAIDQPSSVARFLGKTPVSFPVGLAGLEGSELGRSLGNETGGLPFTVVIAEDGRVIQRKMGQITPQELALWSRSG